MSRNNANGPENRKEEPQYSFDELYFTPFTECRKFDDEGNAYYAPIEKNTRPTGICVLDDFMNFLNDGNSSVAVFCRRKGISIAAFSGLCEVLTGMKAIPFKMKWTAQTLLDLLRYTNLSLSEAGERSGVGAWSNMHKVCKEASGYTPREYRWFERNDFDLGKYRLGD